MFEELLLHEDVLSIILKVGICLSLILAFFLKFLKWRHRQKISAYLSIKHPDIVQKYFWNWKKGSFLRKWWCLGTSELEEIKRTIGDQECERMISDYEKELKIYDLWLTFFFISILLILIQSCRT